MRGSRLWLTLALLTTLGLASLWGAPQVTLPPPSGGGPGTGTANRLARWATTSTLGDSLLSDNGTVLTLTSGRFVLTGGTVTADSPLLSLTQTWNSAATFTAIRLNVTSTASTSNSLLLDLQVGGFSAFNVDRTGLVTVGQGTGTGRFLSPDGTAGAPAYSFGLDPDTGVYRVGTNALGFSTAGAARWRLDASGHYLAAADNTYDIGASGATRPRTIYAATSVVAPAYVVGSTAGVDGTCSSVTVVKGLVTGCTP